MSRTSSSSYYIIFILFIFALCEVYELAGINAPARSVTSGPDLRMISVVYHHSIQKEYTGYGIRFQKREPDQQEYPVFKLERILSLEGASGGPEEQYPEFVLPIQKDYWVSSAYGQRYHPILKKWRFHHGIDLAAVKNTPVYAVSGGKVIYSGYYPGYGKTTIIKHGKGFTTLYAHCRRLFRRAGCTVEQGEMIASVGNTGTSLGYHLHFEIKLSNRSVDPEKYIDFNRLLAGVTAYDH